MNFDHLNLEHGENWAGEDLTGWYLSEKFDGCRAIWNGSKMFTRQGHEISLPGWFRAALPEVPLDGEIWCGYGKLARASTAVRLGRIDKGFRFLVFDSPTAPGDWIDRMEYAKRAIARSFMATAVFPFVCESNAHALELFSQVKARGGEGLIARKPGVPFTPGRSRDILKIKSETPATLREPSPAEVALRSIFSGMVPVT